MANYIPSGGPSQRTLLLGTLDSSCRNILDDRHLLSSIKAAFLYPITSHAICVLRFGRSRKGRHVFVGGIRTQEGRSHCSC